MTLSTDIYITGKMDPKDLFDLVIKVITAVDGVPFNIENLSVETESKGDPFYGGINRDTSMIMSSPGQGLPAWVMIRWDPDGYTSEHIDPVDDDECDPYITPGHDYHLDLDTAYGYNMIDGGCSNLHAVSIAVLGVLLPEGVNITSWRNEYTGDVFYDTNPETLIKLPAFNDISGDDWHNSFVKPALDRLTIND